MDRSPAASCQGVRSTRIERDTYLVQQVPATSSLLVNSLVITGREPVIVDTGASGTGTQWLEELFAVVDPDDVRWIFVSHEDADHIGNLSALLTACPGAMVVCR